MTSLLQIPFFNARASYEAMVSLANFEFKRKRKGKMVQGLVGSCEYRFLKANFV